jgi:hypothetical protein
LALRAQHTVSAAWQVWGQWWQRLRLGQLAVSHQEPQIRRIGHPLALRLGDELELAGYDLRPANPAPGSTLHLTLYWRPAGQITADYTVFAHLLCADGQVCSQVDSQPLKGAYPTSRWHEDGIVQDDYDLPVPAGQPAGPYQVEAGMYLLQTGQRLPITSAGGKRLDQDRILLQPG